MRYIHTYNKYIRVLTLEEFSTSFHAQFVCSTYICDSDVSPLTALNEMVFSKCRQYLSLNKIPSETFRL
jgi:hypothetical protein